MNDKDRQALINELVAQLTSIPEHKRDAAVINFANRAMQLMPAQAIREIREEIIALGFPAHIPIVRDTLNLIDGALALREMGIKDQP